MKLSIPQLRAAGVSDKQILDAMAEAEAELRERRRQQSKARSKNYRARVTQITRDDRDARDEFFFKQNQCSVTRDDRDAKSASLSIKKEKKERGTLASRGTRLAKEWQPDTDDCAYAVEHGLDPKTVARDFRDYWHARAGPNAVKMDWKLTWQRWCRTEQKQSKSKKPQWRSGIEGVI